MFMKKKLLKLKILMIVLLLNCLKIYAQDIPSTGWENNADTAYVSIPIEYIRLANQKMIERNYLEEVNIVKDSILFVLRSKSCLSYILSSQCYTPSAFIS